MMNEPEEDRVPLDQRVREQLDLEIQKSWDALINHEAGRLIVWSILDKCGNFNFDFFNSDFDILMKGRQQIGAEILRDFVFSDGMDAYTKILTEADERMSRLEAAIQAEDLRQQGEDE